jgi:DNA-binding transcriptional MerR regulator
MARRKVMRFRVKDLGIDVHSEDIAEKTAQICPATGLSQCGRCSVVGQTFCTDCTTQAFSICGGTRCGACSVNAVSVVCSDCTTQAFSICGGTPCPAISAEPCAGISLDPVEQLRKLKAQLQEALSQVEQQEAEMTEAMAPQTVEEVDMLQSKLQEALEALQERRAEIQRRAGGTQD